ncbi:hypothetical protein GCM10023091_29400 [Ravibacter arvi]|uniref:DUF11 domain-containing protein n=1 Tax=Ravibacter arvi TaxID=2051041 RepID=A0ABP8M192_9BACT
MKSCYTPAIAGFLLFLTLLNPVRAQTLILPDTPVKEDFNTMANGLALPANWKVSVAGQGSTATWATGLTNVAQTSNSGSPVTGGSYNWGTTTGADRAVGFLSSSGYASPNAVMACFRNTTGAAVTTLTVSFSVERYRVNTSVFSLGFSSSTDGSVWTERSAGNISPGLFMSGAPEYTFDTPATIVKTVTLTGLNIADNADIYLRWLFTDAAPSTAQGLGLDNVSVAAGPPKAVISSTLTDILKTNNPPLDQVNPGDELTYRTAIRNRGTGDATDVVLTEPAPVNTTLIAGSVKTSALARDEVYATSIDTPLSGQNVLSNDYGIPAPAVLSFGPVGDKTATAAGGSGSSDNGGTVALNADGTLVYTPPAGFSGNDRFGYIAGNGNLPDNDAVVTVSVGSTPAANADTYNVVGNVPVSPGSTAGVLSNDTGGGLLVTAVNGNAADVGAALVTGAGGNLTVNTDGSFTYNPAPGFNGSDSFTYTADNGFSAPASATVTLNIAGVVWFVNNNAASNGDGRLGSPFKLITNVTGTAAGQTIFLYESAAGYTGSINLLPAQKLVGQDASESLQTITGLTPDAAYSAQFPAMNSGNGVTVSLTSANADIITLAGGNTIRGLTVGNAGTGKKITGNTFGTLTLGNAALPDVILNGTGQALDLQTGTLTGGLLSLTTTGSAGQGISINSVGGSFHFGATSVSGSATQGILISGASAIVPTFGATTVSSGTDGVSIQGNTGNVTFGSLGITTANGIGLLGTNNTGQVIVTNGTSGINATGGAALNLSQSSGTSTVDLKFSGLTSAGGVNGIHLGNIAGTISAGSGSLTGTGTTFNVNGGTASITYGGNITQTNNAQLVRIEGGHQTGTITFNTGTLSATNGTGLQFDNADGVYNFSGTTTLNGGDAGIDLINGTSGTFVFGSNTTITNPSGTAFNLSGITASNASVTYNGAITDNTGYAVDIDNHDANNVTFQTGSITSTANGIRVQNCGGGAINFNSPTKSLTTAANPAVTLNANTGGTINFGTGGLTINTTSGTGFSATGGGTVNVTGTGNSIVSTTGTALNVNATVIGSDNLNFQSISSNGAANGILLTSTGSVGGLTVTGTGTTPGSGGTIQNCQQRGARFVSADKINLSNMNFTNNGTANIDPPGTAGNALGGTNTNVAAGIDFQGVSNVSLTGVAISGGKQIGLNGKNVSNFSMSNSSVKNAGDENLEDGVQLTELSGNCMVSNCEFSGNFHRQFEIQNSGGNLVLNMTGSTFDRLTYLSTSAQGVLISGHGTAVINASVKSSVFRKNFGSGFYGQSIDNANVTITLGSNGTASVPAEGNTFTDNSLGFQLLSDNASNFTFNVGNNTYTVSPVVTSGSTPFSVRKGTNATGRMTGRMGYNTIGNSTALSGNNCAGCNGISFTNEGLSGGMNVTVNNNTIQHINQRGIEAILQLNDQMSMTVTDNIFLTKDSGSGHAIFMQSGTDDSDSGDLCADIRGNNISGTWDLVSGNIRLRMFPIPAAGSNDSFRVRNAAGVSAPDIVAYLNANNTNAMASATTPSAFIGGSAPCP